MTLDKKIVWTYDSRKLNGNQGSWQFNQYDIFGNGLACSQVLSDKQSALVRKLLARAVSEQYGAKRTNIEIGKYKGFILHPAKPAAECATPWIWYAPTIGSHPNQSNEWILRKLLDRGFYVGGIDVGESYGSAAGRKAFSDFYAHVVDGSSLKPRLDYSHKAGVGS